jgi:molybdopterin converting factor small subunit
MYVCNTACSAYIKECESADPLWFERESALSEKESAAMQVGLRLFGTARAVVGQPTINISFTAPTITLGQILERLIATYPRVQPYVLDETGRLPSSIRVLINHIRPNPDATLATVLHDGDHVTLLIAVAGG